MGLMWSSCHMGERKERRRYSKGQEERKLRIRMQNEVGRQIKETTDILTEDSDMCVSRKYFLKLKSHRHHIPQSRKQTHKDP